MRWFAFLVSLALVACQSAAAGWNLVWNEEFDGDSINAR